MNADLVSARTGRAKRKAPPHAWRPGQSGNPRGGAKRTAEELNLIAACREKTPKALATICALMESADKDSVRLGAATYIIDRGWGKAVQVVEDRNGNPLANAATELLMAMRERLTQTVEERKHLVHVHDR